MKKLLLLACGGTGAEIADKLTSRLSLRYGLRGKMPPNVSVLYIDTSKTNRGARGSSGIGLHLDKEQLESFRVEDRWQDELDLWRWADPEVLRAKEAVDDGASGLPMFARLAMLDPTNFGALQERILQEWERLAQLQGAEVQKQLGLEAPPALDPGVTICVVASAGGGTGNGLFIDLGYLLRKLRVALHDTTVETIGVLCLPSPHAQAEDPQLHRNAAVALLALDACHRDGTTVRVKFPDAHDPWVCHDTPYTWTYLVSPTLNEGDALAGGLDALTSVLSTYLYYDCVWEDQTPREAGEQDPVAARRSDIKHKVLDQRPHLSPRGLPYDQSPRSYFTLGLSSMEFPANLCLRQCTARVVRDLLRGVLSAPKDVGGQPREWRESDLPESDKQWLIDELGLPGRSPNAEPYGNLMRRVLCSHPNLNGEEFTSHYVGFANGQSTSEGLERTLSYAGYLDLATHGTPDPTGLRLLEAGALRRHIESSTDPDAGAQQGVPAAGIRKFWDDFLGRFGDMCLTWGQGPFCAQAFLAWAVDRMKSFQPAALAAPEGGPSTEDDVRDALDRLERISGDFVLTPLRGVYRRMAVEECRDRLAEHFQSLVGSRVRAAQTKVVQWLTSVIERGLGPRATGVEGLMQAWLKQCEETLEETEESTPNRLLVWHGEQSVSRYVARALGVSEDPEEWGAPINAIGKEGLEHVRRALVSPELAAVDGPFSQGNYPHTDGRPHTSMTDPLEDLVERLFRGEMVQGRPGVNVYGQNVVQLFERDQGIEGKDKKVQSLEKHSSLLLSLQLHRDAELARRRGDVQARFCLQPAAPDGGQAFQGRLAWNGERERQLMPEPFVVIWTQEMGQLPSDVITGFSYPDRDKFRGEPRAWARVDYDLSGPPSPELKGLLLSAVAMGILRVGVEALTWADPSPVPGAFGKTLARIELPNQFDEACAQLQRRDLERQKLRDLAQDFTDEDRPKAVQAVIELWSRKAGDYALIGVPDAGAEETSMKNLIIRYAQAWNDPLYAALQEAWPAERVPPPPWARLDGDQRICCRHCDYVVPEGTTRWEALEIRECPNAQHHSGQA